MVKTTRGRLILKCFFDVFIFFQKTNENKLTSSKVEFVRSFFGRNVGLKKSFWICLTFIKQPLDFPFYFCLPCVCLGDLGASVRFSTVSSTKRSSNLSVHKVSILSWSLFFWKRLYKKIRFILINKCEGRTKPPRVPSALWLPNSFP